MTAKKAIDELNELLAELKDHSTTGFDIEGAKDITIKGYKSRGYSSAGRFKQVGNVHLENQDHEAPSKTDIALLSNVIVNIVEELEKEKPDRSLIKQIYEKVIPLGSLGNLVFNVLERFGYI